jgi:hypothetical protein
VKGGDFFRLGENPAELPVIKVVAVPHPFVSLGIKMKILLFLKKIVNEKPI